MRAAVFAGDRRVWRVAVLVAVPLVLVMCAYCALPRDYNTGTDSVEVNGFVTQSSPGQPVCISGLLVPADTARLRFKLISRTQERPALHLRLAIGGRTLRSGLPPLAVRGSRISVAVVPIPQLPARPAATPASLCLIADGLVSWGGTALGSPRAVSSVTQGGAPLNARIAVWYLPRFGAKRSYFSAAATILRRAALFRPGWVGPWLYVLMLLLVMPAIALLAVRCLALAAAGAPPRRLAAWLFVLAALNFSCWALITPPFQAPDEADHFAYTQSLLERGQAPSQDAHAKLPRWSSAETLALERSSFLTDHRSAESRPPWLSAQELAYQAAARSLHPRLDDGGGKETAATHGPIYYAALTPAYALAGSSPFSQLSLMRLTSALIGALTVVFTFLLARELAPGRPWLAVLAALLVVYEPMYGFISGAVNNDVGVNAGAAALELLLIRMLRRGITIPSGALAGALLFALPIIKGTGLSLYPVAALVFVAVLWRRHDRSRLRAWIALAGGAISMVVLSGQLLSGLRASASSSSPSSSGGSIGSNASAVDQAFHHVPDFLSYLWQVFLPRLPFMAEHFSAAGYPAFATFVVRGWAAFGWYTVLFPHWVYVAILVAMLSAIPLGAWAAHREWPWVRRHWLEVGALIVMAVTVIVGFEATFYTPHIRAASEIEEAGRYAFPAIGPLAVLVVGALHAIGRRRMLAAGVALLVAMVALSYASQLLTLTSFYA
jgi:Predicted membrane protein (DUF2142)